MLTHANNFARDGFEIISNVCDSNTLNQLRDHFSTVATVATRERNGATYAIRNLLQDFVCIRELAESAELRSLVEPVLGHDATAVRAILFDKTPGANWKVAWHQDLSIAVKRKVEEPG